MSLPTKFLCFAEDLGRKVHDLGADTLKILLTNVQPKPTARRKEDLSEIAAGNGYPAGGQVVQHTEYKADKTGRARLLGDDVLFRGQVEDMAPFRWAVLYNAAAPGGPLIGYWDRGQSIALEPGDEFVVSFPGREITSVN